MNQERAESLNSKLSKQSKPGQKPRLFRRQNFQHNLFTDVDASDYSKKILAQNRKKAEGGK